MVRFCPQRLGSFLFRTENMPIKENGRIVETATEARQGERGPSVLTLLIVSVALALAAMAVVWFVFFRN
jgi:hypothetical protein